MARCSLLAACCSLWLFALALGCDCGARQHGAPSRDAGAAAVQNEGAALAAGRAGLDASLPKVAAERAPPEARSSPSPPPVLQMRSSGGRDATAPEGSVASPFIVDGRVEMGGAGSATASEHGVVILNREGRLFFAALEPSAAPNTRPRPTPIRPLPEAAEPFSLGHGPAVRGRHAYWVSHGELLRQTLDAAEQAPRVLARDVRAGTRVALPEPAQPGLAILPELAAYIGKPSEPGAPATLELWVEGHAEPLHLTEDPVSAHSAVLANTAHGLWAIFLEARTGMSTLHLRAIERSKTGDLRIGEDRVVWVGGPSRSSTELSIQGADALGIRALLPLERDITHFGLAELLIPFAPAPPIDPVWFVYANGIEPAPLAGRALCGRQIAVLARPSSPVPYSDQELALIDLDRPATEPLLLARARTFLSVSLSPAGAHPEQALLAYAADQRTWVRSIRCLP